MADSRTDASITVGADISQLEAAMQRATQSVKDAASTMASHFEALTGSLSKAQGVLVAFAAALAAGGAFDKAISATNKFTGEVTSLAKSLGITTEEASGLNVALGDIGSDADTYTSALQKLTRQVRTNEEALNAMGIKTRDANGNFLNGRALMDSALEGLRAYKEGTDRNLAAQVAFGKGAADVGKLMKLNSQIQEEATEKAKALGLIVGGDNVAATKAYKLAMNDVDDVMLAIEKTIGDAVIPVLTKMANWFSDGGPTSVSVFKAAADGIGDVLNIVADLFITLWDAAKESLGSIIDLFKNESNETLTFGDVVRNVFSIIGAVLLTFKAAFLVTFDAVRGAIDVVVATLRGFAEVSAAVLHGDFAGAKAAWTNGMNGVADAVKNAGKRMLDDAMKTGQQIADALSGNRPARAATPAKRTDGDKTFTDPTVQKGGRLEDTSKAEYAVAKAQFEAALNLQKEYLKEAQATYDDAYKNGLVDIRGYYAARQAIEEAEFDKDIEAKKKEIEAVQKAEATATTDRERLTLKAQEIKLTGELTVIEAKRAEVAVTEGRAATAAIREQTNALRDLQIQSQINSGNSQVAMDRIALDTRRQLRQTSDAQAIEEEKGFEDQLTAIQAKAIKDRIALEEAGTNNPVKVAALHAQLEELERTHQEKLTQLDAQATIERNKYATQFAQQTQDSFATFFNDLTDRTKKLSDTFKSLFSNIMKSFNDLMSKKIAENLFGAGTQGGGILNQVAGAIFPAAAAPKAPAAAGGGSGDATVAASTALGALAKQADSTAGGMQTLSQTGIGGMFQSTMDWIAEQVFGKTVQAAQTATQTTATTALAALTTAAQAAAAALASVATSGAGSSAGSAAKGAASSYDWMSSIASFDVGTDFVPRDMLAMVHAGERITPAKYNVPTQDRSLTIHQTNTFPPSTSRASTAQQAARIAHATSQAVRRNS